MQSCDHPNLLPCMGVVHPCLGQDTQPDQDMAELPLPTGLEAPAATSWAVLVLPAWGRLLSLGCRSGAH